MIKLKLLTILTVIISLNSYAKNQSQKEDEIREIVPIVTIAPNYPQNAVDNKIEGKVTIEFTVTKEGTVTDPKVISSIPSDGIFDQEALRAILKYKFAPRTINGKPVEAIAIQTIEFKVAYETE